MSQQCGNIRGLTRFVAKGLVCKVTWLLGYLVTCTHLCCRATEVVVWLGLRNREMSDTMRTVPPLCRYYHWNGRRACRGSGRRMREVSLEPTVDLSRA